MYKITDGIEGTAKAAIEALMLCDDSSERKLDYANFTKFIIHVVAASPDHVTFDDVADTMTKQVATADLNIDGETLNDMFAMDRTIHAAVEEMKAATQDQVDHINLSEMTRILRLFNLWDLDKNGTIDFHELALGLR